MSAEKLVSLVLSSREPRRGARPCRSSRIGMERRATPSSGRASPRSRAPPTPGDRRARRRPSRDPATIATSPTCSRPSCAGPGATTTRPPGIARCCAGPRRRHGAEQPREHRVRPRRLPGALARYKEGAEKAADGEIEGGLLLQPVAGPPAEVRDAARRRGALPGAAASSGLISTFDRLWKYDKGDYAVVDIGLTTLDVEQKFTGHRAEGSRSRTSPGAGSAGDRVALPGCS